MENTAEIYEEQGTVREALDNFSVLLDDTDFSMELDLLGIGRLQFLLRRQMSLELKGLYIALWRLALARSFPADADDMFAAFLHSYLMEHSGKTSRHIVQRAREYWSMLLPSGDSDFIAVARHLTSFVVKEQADTRPLELKMALHIRSIYRFIFDRLI